MGSMIERVGRAIAKAQGYAYDPQPYDAYAKAAIEAMREPTERMISEMESAASFGIGRPADDEAIPRVWTWAIDAALKEQEKVG